MTQANTRQREPLMGTAELAARLGVSRASIYRMKSKGVLPRPVKVGALLKWEPTSIERWLEEGAPRFDREERTEVRQ